MFPRYTLLAVAAFLRLTIAPLSAQDPSARARLEAMSAEEKEELAAKRERFEQLPPEEQERIRQLDERLRADPNSELLRGVMNRYYEWLKTLSSDERAALLSKKGEERIEMIRILAFRSMADRRLSQEDLEQVYEWTTEYLRSREETMIESLPEHERDEVKAIEDESRRWRHLFWEMRKHQLPPPSPATDGEITQLIGTLSADARRIFDAAPDEEKRQELVQGWIRASMFSRYQQSVSEEELMQFLHEDLDPRWRAQIESLPRDEMQKELRKHYMIHKFRGFGGPRFRPPGPPGGPPPGRRGARGHDRNGPDGRDHDDRRFDRDDDDRRFDRDQRERRRPD